MKNIVLKCIFFIGTPFFFVGCLSSNPLDHAPEFSSGPKVEEKNLRTEYSFGVFPLRSPMKLFSTYQSMLDEVNQRLELVTPNFESSRDYSKYEEKILSGELDFAIINPYQALDAAERGYRIFAKMGNDEQFRGIIVVRADSNIKTMSDLHGASVSFPAPTAMAATIMNKVFMKKHGLDPERQAKIQYVNSQDSSVINVYMGLTKAGGTWPPTWQAMERERPEITKFLKVQWRTGTLPNLALVAKNKVPDAHVQSVLKSLLSLSEDKRGREVLGAIGITQFEAANLQTYRPVRKFLS